MMSQNSIGLENSYGSVKKIKSVNINMESSTYNAEIFNMAMQMLCLDWQDPAIAQIEGILTKRLIEQEECKEQGYDYLITLQKQGNHSGGQFKVAYRVKEENRAKELASIKYPDYPIVNVEKREFNA